MMSSSMKGVTIAKGAADFSCLVWNIQNLTNGTRQGMSGRVANRLVYVNETFRRSGADMMIVLETGLDANMLLAGGIEQCAEVFHTTNAEPETPGYMPETYCVFFKPEAQITLLDSLELHSTVKPVKKKSKPYRGGVVVKIADSETGNPISVLAAIHAPSPSHPLYIRIAVILDFLNQATAWANGLPVILCGDLNIRQREWHTLADELEAQGYHNLLDPEMTTTFKRFSTTNLTKSQYGSESYDQVWLTDALIASGLEVRAECIDIWTDDDLLQRTLDRNKGRFLTNVAYLLARIDGTADVSPSTLAMDPTEIIAIHQEIVTLINGVLRNLSSRRVTGLYSPKVLEQAKLFAGYLNEYDKIRVLESDINRLNRLRETLEDTLQIAAFFHAYIAAGAGNGVVTIELRAAAVSDHKPVLIELFNLPK